MLEKKKMKDSSRYVVNCDYGKFMELGILDMDLPRMSIIHYDEAGNIIFSDFSKLDEFLEYEFIPQYMKIASNGHFKNKNCIMLAHIIRLQLSEIELKHVFHYLEERKIFVSGFSSILDGEFDNYDYKLNYKTKDLPLPLKEGENEKLIYEYRLTGNRKYRDQVIEHNMRLVRYLSFKYSLKYHIPMDELESYASEALLLAICDYDFSKSKFSTYAFNRIKWNILSAADRFFHQKTPDLIHLFSDERYIDMEDFTEGFCDYSKTNLILDVACDIVSTLSNDQTFCYDSEFSLLIEELSNFEDNKVSLSDIQSSDIVSDKAINKYLKTEVLECLECLPDQQKIVLEYIYGLNGKEKMSKAEVGRVLGITRETVRQREAKALKKLRCPRIKRKLYDYLE